MVRQPPSAAAAKAAKKPSAKVVNFKLDYRKIIESSSESENEENHHQHPKIDPKKSDVDVSVENFTTLDYIQFMKDLQIYGKDKLSKTKGKVNIAKIADSIPMLQKYSKLYNQSNFNEKFNGYYKIASHRSNISLENVVMVIDKYFCDGTTVETFDNFPLPPTRPIDAYVKGDGNIKHSFQEIAEMKKAFANDDKVDTKIYFEQYSEKCKKYVGELQKYLEKYSTNILESHIAHVNKVIAKYEKLGTEIHKSQKPKTKLVGSSGAKKTAFDFYMDANLDKYEGDGNRDQKLQDDFDQLNEGMRKVFENIAITNK